MFPRIKQLRIEAGLNQDAVAKILGCAQSSYANQEDGRRELPLKALVILSHFYQVSVDYMLGLAEVRKPLGSPCFDVAVWEKENPCCERIYNLRMEKGLTQGQAAQGIGRSQQSYSVYEKDEKVLTIRVLVKLSQFYEVSTDYILGLTDERCGI